MSCNSMSMSCVFRVESNVSDLIMEVIRSCGEKYNFDSEEAIRSLDLKLELVNVKDVNGKVKVKGEGKGKGKSKEKKEKIEKSKYPMPFNKSKNENCCSALRQNSGLYTQCENEKIDGDYCKKCLNESKKNESGLPSYGRIEDRLKVGLYEFVDPSGKSPIRYYKLLTKLKISKEEVLEEAKRLNLEIDTEHFEVVEKEKRGRPKSEKVKSEKVKSVSSKKGRPKKENKEVEIISDEREDIFAALVEDANKVNKDNKDKKEVVVDDEANEEVDVVKKLVFEGVTYLKSKNTGVIYNMDQELVGKWNSKLNKIDFEEYEEEEEEYEE